MPQPQPVSWYPCPYCRVPAHYRCRVAGAGHPFDRRSYPPGRYHRARRTLAARTQVITVGDPIDQESGTSATYS